MSEINRPKSIIPDDETVDIAPELYELLDYDEDLHEDEVNEFETSEAQIVANYANYINIDQLRQDMLDKDSNISTYKPAQVIRVISKVVRSTPTGQIVTDYQLEVEEVSGATSYEVRVMAQ
jgi:hypothetical protein